MIWIPKKVKEVLLDKYFLEVVAFFASLSASLFLIISVCLGTHTRSRLAPLAVRLLVARIALICWLCPGLSNRVLSLRILAWLFVKILKCSLSFAILLACSIALVTPLSSLLYTIALFPIF